MIHHPPPPDAPDLAAAWRAAVARPLVAAALESIFADAARAITARGPACWASGRCCRFEQFGHRLYVTGLEAAYTLARADALASVAAPPSTLALRQFAGPAPDCPFQSANLCTVHDSKPLACRVFFCDASAQTWQQDLLERLLRDLRALHDTHAIPYRYLEWRAALAMLGA
ncbi:MAG: YkgJ family cysteine cluster protein [Phycisphaerae bacterium]|nr:YkgJ family cysteine cluster protein [Phycisphaerae bacterium]